MELFRTDWSRQDGNTLLIFECNNYSQLMTEQKEAGSAKCNGTLQVCVVFY